MSKLVSTIHNLLILKLFLTHVKGKRRKHAGSFNLMGPRFRIRARLSTAAHPVYCTRKLQDQLIVSFLESIGDKIIDGKNTLRTMS